MWNANDAVSLRTAYQPGDVLETYIEGVTRSSAEVKERVELYLHSPSGASWPAIVWPLSYKRTAFDKNEEMEFELRVTYT